MIDRNPKVEVVSPVAEPFKEVLTPEVLLFVARLQEQFGYFRRWLLRERAERQVKINDGNLPDFLEETRYIREDSSWKVAPAPAKLQKRIVEIVGPASERNKNIYAMNSGADVSLADAEDAEAPTWLNILKGQRNMYDLVRRQIDFRDEKTGKEYRLNEETATLMFRPRGWHLEEKNVLVNGWPISASLFDFGVYFYNNAKALLERGAGPYFYLPKLESYLEARLWNEIFLFSQGQLGIEPGNIKATPLVETLPASFAMDEILYELKEHSAGLNCGRWDHIFSYIKTLHNYPAFILPDSAQVTMDKDFLAAYVKLLVKTCHKRGAHAMGGMAAQIPSKDPEINAKNNAKMEEDKVREVRAGLDGTWVAHPTSVPVARKVFEDYLGDKPNQLDVLQEDIEVTAQDLLSPHSGEVTEAGLRTNISNIIQYLGAYFGGNGCVSLHDLMLDLAIVEGARSQIWQWRRYKVALTNGIKVDGRLVTKLIEEELSKIKAEVGEEKYKQGQFELAGVLLRDVVLSDEFLDFLSLPAYNCLRHS